jgi:hypothetical protein
MPPMNVENVGRFAMLTDPQGAAFAVIKLNPMLASRRDRHGILTSSKDSYARCNSDIQGSGHDPQGRA